MALNLKLGRCVSQLGRSLISKPVNHHTPAGFVRCLSILPSVSSRFHGLPVRTPKPIFRHRAPPSLSISSSASSVEEKSKPPGKWEGKATAKVNGVSADKVWSLWEDYGNVCKWLPTIDSTSILEGEPGKLGCIRVCTGPPLPGTDSPGFTQEKLVAYDPAARTLSYQVVDNNVGFGEFVATWKATPDSDGGCTIEWSFVSEPMEYWTPEKINGYIGYSTQGMAKIIEEALVPKK